jgi:flagellar hook-associated protein 3 FlgL
VRFNGVSGTVLTGNLDDFALTVDGLLAWEQARSGNGSFVTDDLPNTLNGNPASAWIDSGRVTDPALLTGHNYTIDISGVGPAAIYTVVTDVDLGAVVPARPSHPQSG